MVAEFAGGQQRQQPGLQPIVLTLSRGAGVAADRLGIGLALVDVGQVVVGVGDAGGGQFGPGGLQGGAQRGVIQPVSLDMPSGSCLPRLRPRFFARSSSENSPSGCR